MARKRRAFTTFSLSFLDIMSCGFGAVVLIFLITKHAEDRHNQVVTVDLSSEVRLLEEDVSDGEKQLVKVRNTLSDVDLQVVEAKGLASRIIDEITTIREILASLDKNSMANVSHINKLKSDIESLEKQRKLLKAALAKEQGDDIREVVGDGDRQYLTGLKLGGERMLVLFDTSSSMLDYSIVNIIRRRNMSDEVKKRSPKWQQALAIADWLTAQFPADSKYQFYQFAETVTPLVAGSEGQWLDVNDGPQLDQILSTLQQLIPQKGSNLQAAFSSISDLSPLPDNIYIITDGLPTQGKQPSRSATISGTQRERLFRQAVREIPAGIPINIVLSPLEGDPMAGSHFWRLAVNTNGSYISPSKDWP